jgi:endonuclease/exonuclease/phosphatase family metal-dependent hydrolase
MRIKILQWNIWFQEKVENILGLVKELNPDILCLQEVTIGSKFNNKKDVGKEIAKALKFNYNYSNAHKYINILEDGTKDSNYGGNAIFSRFPIIKNSNFPIINPEDKEDFSYERRICNVSEIKLEKEKIITVATTHGSFNPYFLENKEKLEEINNLVDFFKNKEKLIFTGDLNASPNSKSIKLIEKQLKHCGPDYKKPTWTTKPFSFMGFKETELKWRLDYAFASKDIKVLNSKIIQTEYSDHLPILTEIEI